MYILQVKIKFRLILKETESINLPKKNFKLTNIDL